MTIVCSYVSERYTLLLRLFLSELYYITENFRKTSPICHKQPIHCISVLCVFCFDVINISIIRHINYAVQRDFHEVSGEKKFAMPKLCNSRSSKSELFLKDKYNFLKCPYVLNEVV